MKLSCVVLILTWSIMSDRDVFGYILTNVNQTQVTLNVDGNNLVLTNDKSWLQMVLVFASDSHSNQSTIFIEDKPCIESAAASTTKGTERDDTATTKGSEIATAATTKGPERDDAATTKGPEIATAATTKGPEIATAATTKGPEIATAATTKGPDDSIVCKVGFIRSESNKCYFITDHKLQLSWHDALRRCESMGTTLAYPMNTNENAALANYLTIHHQRHNWYWLGGSDEAKEGQWVWAHNNASIIYSDWMDGSPSDGIIHNCLYNWGSSGWKWDDYSCNSPGKFICQQ